MILKVMDMVFSNDSECRTWYLIAVLCWKKYFYLLSLNFMSNKNFNRRAAFAINCNFLCNLPCQSKFNDTLPTWEHSSLNVYTFLSPWHNSTSFFGLYSCGSPMWVLASSFKFCILATVCSIDQKIFLDYNNTVRWFLKIKRFKLFTYIFSGDT